MQSATTDYWLSRLRDFIPRFVNDSPALRTISNSAAILLHGSTTQGIDDAVSDLDLWVLLPDSMLPSFDALSPTRFVEFKLDGKPGHFTVESRDLFARRVDACDLPLICELRTACVLQADDAWAEQLVRLAQRPMPESVRRAWFAHHYIEMRSEHRACDNPIDRNDAAALLQAFVPAISHALRAAMVIDGQPYPYVKWLAHAARETPAGCVIAPLVEQAIDLIGRGALRQGGPERLHPLNLALKQMRTALIAAARERGIDEPWLDLWYLHLDERWKIRSTRWHDENI